MKSIVQIVIFFALLKINVSQYLGYIEDIENIENTRYTAIFFNSYGKNICSGALIHSLWLLTTATCAKKLYDEERRFQIGGKVKIDFDKASYIKNVIIHPSYQPEKLENDIALVELVTPTENINRMLKISQEWIIPGQQAIALGYGENGVNTNGILKQKTVTIIDNNICLKYSAINLDFNRLCAYQSRACEGDQGGPLLIQPNNKLIGIISINKNQAGMCGGGIISPITTFVRLSSYIHWIRKMTNIVYL